MVYFILTIVVILGIPAWLTGLRYYRTRHDDEKFFGWLFRQFHKPAVGGVSPDSVQERIRRDFSFWDRIILFILIAGFGTAAVTGILFSLFSPRGIFGLPLIVHVISGGFFSVALAAGILVWVRHFASLGGEGCENPPSPHRLNTLVFWVFCFSGLILISTALAMMLPVFPFRAQIALFSLHRYAALAGTASAIIGTYRFFSISRST